MAKKKSSKKKRINTVPPKKTLQELQASRDGGQIALAGFTYQLLYSCFLVLSESNTQTVFHLEGIEDIDRIKYEHTSTTTSHLQLKYSSNKQDASFLKDVMKNFLEVYLIDGSHNFKLIYDFAIAKGNLSKLLSCTLDEKSIEYWKEIIDQIRIENPLWDWSCFQFETFLSKLSFERKDKSTLTMEIEKVLIESYGITTDNIALFANSMKVYCLEKMTARDSLTKNEFDTLIQNVKDDISKGIQNLAHGWIKKLSFSDIGPNTNLSYFEGKKPTPQDIARQLPVRRTILENEIKNSLHENTVTVIKASSGQGKTTLALQSAYNLRDEYTAYQLLWCNDPRELHNIVQYFKTRVKLGEKPLIIIDNLDVQLLEWNRLVQLLQDEVSYHYKLLLTTREDDWYHYSGNLSNVKSLQTVKLTLEQEEARQIYYVLKKAQKLHLSISNWENFWLKVADRSLLIEYIYLLTHGEMLSERIADQIVKMNDIDSGKIKYEILRKVCFADVCGIRLSATKLINSLTEKTNKDIGEIIKSIENEFLIRVDTAEKYIEGLHPVRSQHMLDRLHEYIELNQTALQVTQIVEDKYIPKLFSKFPQMIQCNKKDFYFEVIKPLWNANDLSIYLLALQGVFSGSALHYLSLNRCAFDDANKHGGLFLLSTELCPFTRIKEFSYELNTLDKLQEIEPDNSNIKYLRELRDATPKIALAETDIYHLCSVLFDKLKTSELHDITTDAVSYSSIAYWLMNIDPTFNLAKSISLEKVLTNKKQYTLDVLSSIMYVCFFGDRESYMNFIGDNLTCILSHLRVLTHSFKLYVSDDGKEVYTEYILLPSDIDKSNHESASRLRAICMALPIFEKYHANAITPKNDLLSVYDIPNDAQKAMPIRNIAVTFQQEFNSLWNKTLLSNYEFDSVLEWFEHWVLVRKGIVAIFQKSVACAVKLLEGKPIRSLVTELNNLVLEVNGKLIQEARYPNEDRPFEAEAVAFKEFGKIKSEYFENARRFCSNVFGFLLRDDSKTKNILFDLRGASIAVEKMQSFFEWVSKEYKIPQNQHSSLCKLEVQSLQTLMMTYLYFAENQPSKYFNKHQIKIWYNERQNQTMQKAANVMSRLSEDYTIVFPDKYYLDDKGILTYYPIIVGGLDVNDLCQLTSFLCSCTSFLELDFDYLIVVIENEQRKVMFKGLSITKKFLEDLKSIVDADDAEMTENLCPPFPVEVTTRVLGCFKEPYEVLVPPATEYSEIERIAELLWTLSKSQEVIDNDIVCQGRTKIDIISEIRSLLTTVESRIPQRHYVEISQLCEEVFRGQKFDDNDFNMLLNMLIDICNSKY